MPSQNRKLLCIEIEKSIINSIRFIYSFIHLLTHVDIYTHLLKQHNISTISAYVNKNIIYMNWIYTYQSSVLWICWRAFVYASALSRDGKISVCEPIDGKCFLENRLRWKLCLIADTCVLWLSAMLRSTSTHCWRLAAFAARIFNVSPDVQVIVNVRESSSLGLIMAPAKCS